MTGFLETVAREYNIFRSRAFSGGYEGVTHAGIALVALDTGRVFLTKRADDETDDPEVRGTWEWPGGGLNPGEEPYPGAVREVIEETGWGIPDDSMVESGWRSEDGVYQGFLVTTGTEFPVDGWSATTEVADIGWFDYPAIQALDEVGALRPEMRNTDWGLIFASVSGNPAPEREDPVDEPTETTETEAVEPELTLATVMPGAIPIHGVLAPENTPSGDLRGFNEAALTRRDALRLPFRWQEADLPGHQGAFVVGSIDRMMRKDGMIHWEGELLDSSKADEFVGVLAHFGKFGVSIDADQGATDDARSEAEGMTWFDAGRIAGATACAIPAFSEAWVALGPHPEMPAADTEEALVASGVAATDIIGARASMEFRRGPGWVTHPVETERIHGYWTEKGKPGYAKIGWGKAGDYRRCLALVGEKIAKNSPEDMRFMKRICAEWHNDALGYWPGDLGKPGNAPDTPENRKRAAIHAADQTDQALIEKSDAIDAELREVVESVEGLEPVEGTDAEWEAVLVSSAAGAGDKTVRPPLSYFHRHPDTGALVVEDPDEFGFQRTYGYAAEWGVCHIGFDNRCVEPPVDETGDYPEFHLGRTRVEGGVIKTGLLTYGVGHRDAKTILSESPTQAHFDNIKNAWAAVRIGNDERGIWFSGVVLPKVDTEDLTLIQAAGQVSGEWKHGSLRALLTVNVPGFPVVEASAEYDEDGNVLALAASAFGATMEVNGVENSPCAASHDDPVGELAIEVMSRIEARKRMDALREADAVTRFAALRENWKA